MHTAQLAFVIAAALSLAAPTNQRMSVGSPPAGACARAAFDAFFNNVTKAEQELFRGRPESLKALWSRAPEVTLFGVSGGSGEHGWKQVGPRLDWTNTQYRDGTLTTERLASYVDERLRLLNARRCASKFPVAAEESILEIRATWIFRREPDGWRIIHRHADSLMKRQGPADRKT